MYLNPLISAITVETQAGEITNKTKTLENTSEPHSALAKLPGISIHAPAIKP